MQLGDTILKLCKEKNISLSELSRKAGVPKQTLHAWTLGRRSVNPVQVKKVAAVLQISVHELFFSEPDPFSKQAEELLKEIFKGDVRLTIHKIERG